MENDSNLQRVPQSFADYSPLYRHGFRRIGLLLVFSGLAYAGGLVGNLLHEIVFYLSGASPAFAPFFLEKRIWMVISISVAWTLGAWWGAWGQFVDVFQKLREGDPKFRDRELASFCRETRKSLRH